MVRIFVSTARRGQTSTHQDDLSRRKPDHLVAKFTREKVRDNYVHHHARDNAEHDPIRKAAGRAERDTVSASRIQRAYE